MLLHQGTKIIKTERLVLRPFTVDDAQKMFDNWANDSRVTRFLTWQPHGTVDVTVNLLSLWCEEYKKSPAYYNWAIEYDGEPIGGISVVRFSEKSDWAELGYSLSYDYWNKGIMTESAKAVIDFLFTEVGFNRVGLSHAVKNPASGRVAQKCGMIFEGTKRQYYKTSDGQYLDLSDYGITKNEWLENKVTTLADK